MGSRQRQARSRQPSLKIVQALEFAGVQGIVAEDVTVTYRNGHTALRHASFAIPTGTITALVGVNGAGKSTLFKAIMGFVPVAGGRISVLGMSVHDALARNLIAYVPQAEEVDWNFPVLVEDVVMMGRYGHMNFLRIPSKNDRRLVDEALARVGMGDYRKRQIGELSGGQRKRVFLARALAQEGQVILLDEPFTGVDVTTEEQIITLMRDLRAMGMANPLIGRSRKPLTRGFFLRAADLYAERYADPDGRIRATFSMIFVSGWAPHESQQQPLKPGSAKMRLAEALDPNRKTNTSGTGEPG